MEYQPFAKTSNLITPVSADIESLREAANVASQTYWNNRTNADLMEIQLSKLNVAPEYEFARKKQLETFKKGIGEIASKQNFMGATSKIADMIKQYETNAQLSTAVANTSKREAFMQSLQQSFDAGEYDADDYQHAIKLNTLPDISETTEFGTYRSFQPLNIPQYFNVNQLYETITNSVQMDGRSDITRKLIGEKVAIPSITENGPGMVNMDVYTGKKVTTSTHNFGKEAGYHIRKAIEAEPKAMQYLKHKVSIDLTNNKELNPEGKVYSWMDIKDDDPLIQAKINEFAERAIEKKTTNYTTTDTEDIDPTIQLNRMRKGANLTPQSTGLIGDKLTLTQNSNDEDVFEAIDAAAGLSMGSWFGEQLKSLGNMVSTVTGGNPFDPLNIPKTIASDAIDVASSAKLKQGFEYAKAILSDNKAIKIENMADLRKPEVKALLKNYINMAKLYRSTKRENIDFIPYRVNQEDPDVKTTVENYEAQYNAGPTNYTYYSTDDLTPYKYEDLSSGEKTAPKVSVVGRTTSHNHLVNVNPRLYQANVVEIKGRKFFVTNESDLDAKPVNQLTAIESYLWSTANKFRSMTPKATHVKVPVYVRGGQDFPQMSRAPMENAAKFNVGVIYDDRGRELLTYTNPNTGDSYTYDPSNPKMVLDSRVDGQTQIPEVYSFIYSQLNSK